MNDECIEKALQAKQLNAPRLTPEHIENTIKLEQFHVFPNTTTTVCCLHLRNGFTVIGESACVSPENFDEEIGKDIARQNAKDKIWLLEGYLLKQRIYENNQNA